MGSYLSRWKRKPSTVEVLEKLDKDIAQLEKSKQTDTERQKRIIASLIIYSILFYICSALLFYFYYMPTLWIDRICFSLPLLIFPLIIWLLKRFLHWYYVKRSQKNDEALEKLKEQKKKILEEVMENETYKKAKDILEKFAPTPLPPSPQQTPSLSDRRLREQASQRFPPGTPSPNLSMSMMSAANATPILPSAVQNIPPQAGNMPPPFGTPMRFRPSGPPLPRPVLPRERSVLDRLMEYLIGDGPQNRYALICTQCQSHNGMALREEFEYMSFRCCYCFYVNEARKHRPSAPSLGNTLQLDGDQTVIHKSTTEPEDDADGEATMNDNEEDASAMDVEHVSSNDHHKDEDKDTEMRTPVSDDCRTGSDDVCKDSHSKKMD